MGGRFNDGLGIGQAAGLEDGIDALAKNGPELFSCILCPNENVEGEIQDAGYFAFEEVVQNCPSNIAGSSG